MAHKKKLKFPGPLTPDKGTAERPGASQGRHSKDPTWSDLSDYLLEQSRSQDQAQCWVSSGRDHTSTIHLDHVVCAHACIHVV